jgi:AcrR family transcriptional regulator
MSLDDKTSVPDASVHPANDARPTGLGDACIAEALRVIAQDGFDKLSLREVARRLGVSHQAPYRHFESRDHLIVEVLRRCFHSLTEALRAREPSDDPVTDLHRMGAAYLSFAAGHPVEYDLMFSNRWPEVAASMELVADSCFAFEELRDVLTRLRQAQGRASDKDTVDRDAMFVWSSMHGIAAILQTDAMENLQIAADVRKDVPAHIMGLIDAALRA